MILEKDGIAFEWSDTAEEFFIVNKIFLDYPWKQIGVLRPGQKVTIARHVIAEPFSNMSYGRFYSSGSFSYCRSTQIPADFRLGRYCSVAPGVQLSDQDHPLDRVSTHSFSFKTHARQLAKSVAGKDVSIHSFRTLKPAPDIGNDVWLGRDSLIKRGITIGNGAVVAQRALVTKDVPPYAIVAGVPARIVRFRFPEDLIARMLKVGWWDYSFFDFGDIDSRSPSSFLDEFEHRIEAGLLRRFDYCFIPVAERLALFFKEKGLF